MTRQEENEQIGKLIKNMDKDLHIYAEALKIACKTLNVICLTQDYELGLELNEKYFIKKAKENLKK